MSKKENPNQMDFFEQQDVTNPDFIPSEKEEHWRLEQQEGEPIKRLRHLDYAKEAARRNAIAKNNLKKIKKMLEEKNK